jgi:cytochrome c556
VHLGCAGLLGLALFGWGAAEEPRLKPDAVAVFMRAKLAHSSEVLEGLALEDFDMIGRGAQELSLASQASSWQVLQTEDYARQSAEFRRSCDTLRTAAKARNLDGAALAWMDVTMKCIQCHKYVRDQK